jgi:predicted O-linked N-acetylglucosamine transferase (SPINDLY family)
MTADDIQTILENALRLHQAGQFEDAEQQYRQVLARSPDEADALHLLGMLTGQTARYDESRQLLERAVEIEPDNPFYLGTLGDLLLRMGDRTEALNILRQVVALEPDLPAGHALLGDALKAVGDHVAAIAALREAVRLDPANAHSHFQLAETLRMSGQWDESIAPYRRSIELNPNDTLAQTNLGIALAAARRFDEAIDSYRRALAIKPNSAELLVNVATALRDSGRADEAVEADRRAIQINPQLAEAHSNLANDLRDLGLIEEAIAANRHALKIRPDLARAHSNLLFLLHYLHNADPNSIAAEHRAWGQKYAAPLTASTPSHSNDLSTERPLRIGYVSADFRRHSVGYFFLPLIEHRNRRATHVFCYSTVFRPDDFTHRMKSAVDGWHDLTGASDTAMADAIRADRIDILVDLAGHTSGNRLGVFARKPAPVQITWLGYPNSTGVTAIDYRLTDDLADPPGTTEQFYVEKLWRLPGCAWCYASPEDTPPVVPRAGGPLTFGCFNTFPKINLALVKLWAELLSLVPGSRLLLKAAGAGQASARHRLLETFQQHGISADRIEMRGRTSETREHLETYGQVDIALDTYPYHGTTTTCEALWMGVPVVTLAGQLHFSRVGVSLLTHAGLPELIAHSPAQYISIAVDLAGNADRLRALRSSLRQKVKSSPLMDAPSFAKSMDDAYRAMWRAHVNASHP